MDHQALEQQSFETEIKPFFWSEHADSVSLCLFDVDCYKTDVFATRADDGFEGNGYDWGSLAQVFIHEKHPEWQDIIKFDPEGSMFCVYTEMQNKEVLKAFALAFKQACENDKVILDLFSRAELD